MVCLANHMVLDHYECTLSSLKQRRLAHAFTGECLVATLNPSATMMAVEL